MQVSTFSVIISKKKSSQIIRGPRVDFIIRDDAQSLSVSFPQVPDYDSMKPSSL